MKLHRRPQIKMLNSVSIPLPTDECDQEESPMTSDSDHAEESPMMFETEDTAVETPMRSSIKMTK